MSYVPDGVRLVLYFWLVCILAGTAVVAFLAPAGAVLYLMGMR